jgi:hypothetical protein
VTPNLFVTPESLLRTDMPGLNDQTARPPAQVHIPFLADFCKELTSGTSSEAVPSGPWSSVIVRQRDREGLRFRACMNHIFGTDIAPARLECQTRPAWGSSGQLAVYGFGGRTLES